MTGEKLTDRQRYRTQSVGALWWRRQVVVLQVEVSWPDGDADMHGLPNRLAGAGWRDARVEDLPTTPLGQRIAGNYQP